MEHSRIYYVPRVGVSYQKSALLEIGICRQWSFRADQYSKKRVMAKMEPRILELTFQEKPY
jgi:hypothetical protein